MDGKEAPGGARAESPSGGRDKGGVKRRTSNGKRRAGLCEGLLAVGTRRRSLCQRARAPRTPRVFRRATTVSQGGAASISRKAVGQVASKHPSEGYKARPDRALRTAVCNAGRVESLVLQGRIIIAVQCVCICCLGVCE
jgi:hypothetical protein